VKNRTRKKRYLGEYSKYGFSVDFEFSKPWTEIKPHIDSIWDDLIEYFDSNNYSFGGGSNDKTLGIVIDGFNEEGSQKFSPRLTNLDKDKILKHLSTIEYLKITEVSGWINMCYPDNKQLNQYNG
jgi:uncharacterized protein YggL (DUF469 family)